MASDLPGLDKEEVQNIVDLYKEIFQPAVRVVSAAVRPNPASTSYFITSQWSQRSLERGSAVQILRTILADSSLTSGIEVNAVDVSNWVLHAQANNKKLKAVIHTTTSDDAKAKTKYFLDIWSDEKLLMSFDLSALNLHGPVYSDEMFSSFSWSKNDEKIIYIAEKKQPKTVPFYQQKIKTDSKEEHTEELVGEQFVYEDDWGEQMSPKTHPVIAVCDTVERKISILKGVPTDVSPGQVIWEPSGDGVVGLGVYHQPRRLGIIYCTNRRSCIFHLSTDEKFTVLSDENMSVFSPKFSPDGKYLIWLQRLLGGPHHSVCALVKCEWSTKKITTVVDFVKSVAITKNGKNFYGIYSSNLPRNCWSSDSKYVLLSTSQTYCVKSYAINIDDGSIWDISPPVDEESSSILDVTSDDYVLCCKSSFSLPPVLASLHLPTIEKRSFADAVWNCLTKPAPIVDDNIISRFTVLDKDTNDGFAVLIVNYRGSTGCGKDFLDALPGHVGSLDVEDCYAALQSSFDKFPWLDPKNVILFGGSHGGFLVTHLSSRYPDDFKAVAAVNPVVNLTAMAYITDIPDWTTVEAGHAYESISNIMVESDLWKALWRSSPMYHVKKVKAPTLLLLGKRDLRVPCSPGLAYYQALKELKVPTKVLYYDDNHSLATVPVEMDYLINTALWFRKCLKRV